MACAGIADGERWRVVLLGAGHCNVQVMVLLAQQRAEHASTLRFDMTLISDYPHAYYSGMLPGCIAGRYTVDDLRIDLAALCDWCAPLFRSQLRSPDRSQHHSLGNTTLHRCTCEFVASAATRIDAEQRCVHVASGASVPFDLLAIDIGSTTRVPTQCLLPHIYVFFLLLLLLLLLIMVCTACD